MFPCIEIRLEGILRNLEILKKACESRGISLSLVTKVLGGNHQLVEDLIQKGNIATICDSRIQNLRTFGEIQVEKWLIRSPMLSEAGDVVKYANVSLNSELAVLQALNTEAIRQNKVHKVILMYECGDLREGCYLDELAQLITECDGMRGIEVYGIGTNLSCLNEVLPSAENMAEFENAVLELESRFHRTFPVISGGASSSIPLLLSDGLNGKINNLRMGEAVFLGNIPVYDKPFADADTDNFILKAEIIELKKKPAEPGVPSDRLMSRAIVSLGKQDIYLPGLSCADSRIRIIGGSSDHIILDVSACAGDYAVGSAVSFRMNYNCLLNAMTSSYIEKIIL